MDSNDSEEHPHIPSQNCSFPADAASSPDKFRSLSSKAKSPSLIDDLNAEGPPGIASIFTGPTPTIAIAQGRVSAAEQGVVNRHSFPFLKLPQELRFLVYDYALSAASTVGVHRTPRPPTIGNRPRRSGRFKPNLYYSQPTGLVLSPRLLRSCKVVYSEALPYLYANKTFYVMDNHALLPRFLDCLSDHAKTRIECLRIDMPSPDMSGDANFHWAMTCIQVAALSATLKRLEVVVGVKVSQNDWTSDFDRRKLKCLCKVPTRTYPMLVKDKGALFYDELYQESFDKMLEEEQLKLKEEALTRETVLEYVKVENISDEEWEEVGYPDNNTSFSYVAVDSVAAV